MKRLILSLFVLLTLALLAALFVQERQVQQLDEQITRLTRQLFKSEMLCKRQSTQIAELKASEEAAKAETEALRDRLHAAPAPEPAFGPVPVEPKPGYSGRIKEMMADPQTKQAMLKEQTAALQQVYADYVNQAGLDAQETEKLLGILAARQEARMESLAGQTPAAPGDFQEQLKALLGEQRAAQLVEFERAHPVR